MKTAVIHSYNGMGDLIWHLPYIQAVARQSKEKKVISQRNVVLFKPSKVFKDFVNLKNE